MTGNLKSYLAELIGTFAIVFMGAGAVCVDALTSGKITTTGIGLAFGLVVTIMVHIYGPVSGAHFNPAVTAAMLAHARIDKIKGTFYIVSQLLGAALAALFLRAILRGHDQIFSAPPFLGACDLWGVGFKAATLLEAVLTFLLVTVIYATAIDARGSTAAAPLAIGAAVALGAIVAGPLTGAAMNPARAFGPAIATGHWSHWYVYWVGPMTGAFAASLLYENIYLMPREIKS